MSKDFADLSSQGLAFSAVIERQRLELRNIDRVVDRSPIVRDLERMQLIANVLRDCRQIAEALQIHQQQAINAQRLLSRSIAFEALYRMKRVTELQQRQLRSIAQAVSRSLITSPVRPMDLAFSNSALARDIRGVAEAAGRVQAQAEAVRRALRVSLNFQPLGLMGASVLLGVRQSLARVAETVLLPSRQVKQRRSSSSRITGVSKARNSYAVGPASKEAYIEWRISVFLARLPTYFEPLEDPPPKHQMH